MNAKITVKVTLVNSHGISAEDTVEEVYPHDPTDDEVKETVKGFGRGFRNMMEVLRTSAGQNGKPSAAPQNFGTTRGTVRPR